MKNKKLWISIIVSLIPYILGIIFYNDLPEQLPVHWNIEGEIDSYASKNFALFGIPTFMILVHFLCLWGTKKDPKNKEVPEVIMNILYMIVPIITIFVMLMMINFSIPNGLNINVTNIVSLLIGILFIVLGNYLPKCKQSYTIGIKTPWTLEDYDIWNKTHRLGGFMFIIMGLGFLLMSFLSKTIIIYTVVGSMFACALIPIFYSYVLYKKKHRGK